ncbi:hypothetical protein LCGC14_1153230 [marine sediment metagenome]|uniref:Uncharacterized protein n=1 Tax=marine sediment metagenome TaxID=412755 RepID=A0A0F9LZS2_9ZZZZ
MSKHLNRQRLVPFPAFSYAFIQRGVNHTRTLATWTLLQKSGLEALSRGQVVRIICQRMNLSPKQARCILRRGDRKFWQITGGMVYPERPAALAALISDLKLARVVKRSKMYVPEVALRNLGQLRAHLALPVISRSPDRPTPRAYTACCLRRTLNTVSVYRHWLRTSGFIFTRANYRRWPREYFDLGRGRFLSSEGRWLVQRLPDLVELNPANIFRVNKGSKNIQGVLNPGFLGYRFNPSYSRATFTPSSTQGAIAGRETGCRRISPEPPHNRSAYFASENGKVVRNGFTGRISKLRIVGFLPELVEVQFCRTGSATSPSGPRHVLFSGTNSALFS